MQVDVDHDVEMDFRLSYSPLLESFKLEVPLWWRRENERLDL